MDFDRRKYKHMGSAAFRHNYWYSVLAALVLAIASGKVGFRFSYQLNGNRNFNLGFSTGMHFGNPGHVSSIPVDVAQYAPLVAAILSVGVVVFAIFLCLHVFLLNPLSLGGKKFFVTNALTPAKLGELGYGFNSNSYLRNVGILFFRDLYIMLWYFLFLIPGIIKRYEYFFVPYLTVAHPEMDRRTVFAASKAMTDGHKFDIFVMQLSFLGWDILSAITGITGGLGGIFYVNPYKQASYAEMYWDLARQIGL